MFCSSPWWLLHPEQLQVQWGSPHWIANPIALDRYDYGPVSKSGLRAVKLSSWRNHFVGGRLTVFGLPRTMCCTFVRLRDKVGSQSQTLHPRLGSILYCKLLYVCISINWIKSNPRAFLSWSLDLITALLALACCAQADCNRWNPGLSCNSSSASGCSIRLSKGSGPAPPCAWQQIIGIHHWPFPWRSLFLTQRLKVRVTARKSGVIIIIIIRVWVQTPTPNWIQIWVQTPNQSYPVQLHS